MRGYRLLIGVILLGSIAFIGGALSGLVIESAHTLAVGLGSLFMLAVILLAVGHGIHHRSREDTVYW